MSTARTSIFEQIQQTIAQLLTTSPAGRNLCLIGGFRYRLLDQSVRASVDIDYHWGGDLEAKQRDLLELFDRRLLPEIKRRFGYDGDARAATGLPSPAVSVVELAFYRRDVAGSRIEIPVEITRIACLDPPAVRTVGGVIYLTATDADLIESKVIAIVNRSVVEHRDLCDLFLFASHLRPDASERIQSKLASLSIDKAAVATRLSQLRDGRAYHIRSVEGVLAAQVDTTASANLHAAGGAAVIFDAAMDLLQRCLAAGQERKP